MIGNIVKSVVLWLLTTFSGLLTLFGLFAVATSSEENTNGPAGLILSIVFLFLTILFARKAIKVTRQPIDYDRRNSRSPTRSQSDRTSQPPDMSTRTTRQSNNHGGRGHQDPYQGETGGESQLSDILPDTHNSNDDGYTPANAILTFLDAEALEFWNGKRTDYEIPPYYQQSPFGRNVGPARSRLLTHGYLALGDMEKRISLKTVPELKAILAEYELKVSGNKKELVYRLLNNLDEDQLEALFPISVYHITQKGIEALEPYSILKDSAAHSLSFSTYRLLKAKESHPNEDNETILSRMVSNDLQDCFRRRDRTRYQVIITTAARFAKEIGDYALSFERYSLSFFIWSVQATETHYTNPTGQAYYMALNLEEVSQLCGYGFSDMLFEFRNAIRRVNPFALASEQNISAAENLIKTALGME